MEKSEIKILKFETKPKEVLSNDEIMKVFGGLIRLVQRSAEYSAFEKVKKQIDNYSKKIEDVTSELNKRTNQVNELLMLNEELMSQIEENKGKLL